MNDIDFDELDRAVNSLSGQAADTAPAAPASSTDPSTPAETAPATPPLAPPTAPVAPRPATGRFMDVVHPSSDMRTAVNVPSRPAAGREAAPIQPPSRPADSTTTSATTAADTAPDVVAESPFLPDAKVEKRPLGAFADTTTPSSPTPEPSLPADPLAAENTDKPIVNDTPLPRELQDDLLMVETNEEEPAAASFTGAKMTESAPSASDTPQAPASILQQYVEKTDAPAPPTTSIFDVQNYQKTVGGKKKKSGWMVVLWILLLIVIGAGVGAAVYFYVLPML